MENVYYDIKHVGSFGGIRALARATKKSLSKTKKWLMKQDTYTLHRPARRRMRKYRSYYAPFFGYQMQADLNELFPQKLQNDGYKYLMTCIDIFSRYAWAVPLKSKKPAEVKEAFKDKIFPDCTPIYLQTDQGLEFYGAPMKQFLENKKVKLFSVKSPQKAAIVERLNRTLKQRMFRYFTRNNTQKWIDIIDDLVDSYNNSPHRSLPKKMTPFQMRYNKGALFLEQPDKSKAKFKVGDAVRLSKIKKTFEKSYLQNWTSEIFYVQAIDRQQSPIMYVIKDYHDRILEGKFYADELQLVIPPEEWPIERVIRRRGNRYLVKFLNDDAQYWVDNLTLL